MSRLVITGASILNQATADIVIDSGKIVEVAKPGAADTFGARVIDAAGLIALPGFVDLHRAAARVPDSTVSASSRPGSRKWV